MHLSTAAHLFIYQKQCFIFLCIFTFPLYIYKTRTCDFFAFQNVNILNKKANKKNQQETVDMMWSIHKAGFSNIFMKGYH